MIPLSNKDAEDLRNVNDEDARRRNSILGKATGKQVQGPTPKAEPFKIVQGKSGDYYLLSYNNKGKIVSKPLDFGDPKRTPKTDSPLYSARQLSEMMRERPFGAVPSKSSGVGKKGTDPVYYTRIQDKKGNWVNVPVYHSTLSEAEEESLKMAERKYKAVNSLKFNEYGDAYVNGRYAPELTNTLKSIIKGKLPLPAGGLPTGGTFTKPPMIPGTGQNRSLPTGVIGYDSTGRPILSRTNPPTVGTPENPFIVDNVRVTGSLLKTYITSLGKAQGVNVETLSPGGKLITGEELYSKLFPQRTVFVFGSNLQGIHGKGAALDAVQKYGAVRGQGVGLQGQSYAIPTKSTPSKSLTLPEIKSYVDEFLDFARKNPDTKFNLTAIGTGLAGFKPDQIAPLFADAPENVIKPREFGGTGWTMPGGKQSFVKVEGGSKGRGTPVGDAKDIEMRRVSNSAIVELVDAAAQSRITGSTSGAVGKTSSETSLLQLGPIDDDLSGKTIMLARNGKLSNQPLRPETINQITRAAQAGANFVVGDMPGVDSEFIKLLDKLNAPYKVYYTGNEPRIQPTAGTEPKPSSNVKSGKLYNLRNLVRDIPENEMITERNLPKNSVYIGREIYNDKFGLAGTPWGNPFKIWNRQDKIELRNEIKARSLKEGGRAGQWTPTKQKMFDEAVDKNIQDSLTKYEAWARERLKANPKWLEPLVNKNLVDWCQPGKCHGDVLTKLIGEKYGFKTAPGLKELRQEFEQLKKDKQQYGEGRMPQKDQARFNYLKNYLLSLEAKETPETSLRPTPQIEGRLLQEDLNPEDPNASAKDRAPIGKGDIQSKYPPRSDSPRFNIQAVANTDGAPGVYIDGEYDGKLTYALVSTMTNIKKNPKTWQRIKQQGGAKIGGVFVSISEMERFSKSIPANMEVIYNKDGQVTMKPRTAGGAAFRTLGATTNALGLLVGIGDIIRLTQEWNRPKPRPVS